MKPFGWKPEPTSSESVLTPAILNAAIDRLASVRTNIAWPEPLDFTPRGGSKPEHFLGDLVEQLEAGKPGPERPVMGPPSLSEWLLSRPQMLEPQRYFFRVQDKELIDVVEFWPRETFNRYFHSVDLSGV